MLIETTSITNPNEVLERQYPFYGQPILVKKLYTQNLPQGFTDLREKQFTFGQDNKSSPFYLPDISLSVVADQQNGQRIRMDQKSNGKTTATFYIQGEDLDKIAANNLEINHTFTEKTILYISSLRRKSTAEKHKPLKMVLRRENSFRE